MGRRMKAIYHDAVVEQYRENPFIEAMPPMLSGKELIDALASVPAYSNDDRDRPPGVRVQLLSNLYEFYQPLPMTIDLYTKIYTSMQFSFAKQSGKIGTEALVDGYRKIRKNEIGRSVGGGDSFAFVGVSGLGKSTALRHALSLFPETIEHENYKGKPLFCAQIPYLMTQTPHDCSVKAMCLEILGKIDDLTGTSYLTPYSGTRASADILVSRIAQITRSHHIGILVVDEVQNLVYGKSSVGIRLLNFLVQLVNSCAMGVCMVGTPRIYDMLEKEFRAARRATGLVYDRLKNNKEFELLVNGLWRYQYTRYSCELTKQIVQWLYNKSQGIPDIVAKILYHAQYHAIISGREILDIAALELAVQENLAIISGFMSAIESMNKRSAEGTACEDIAYISPQPKEAAVRKKDAQDIRTLFRKARRDGISGAEGLRAYIKGEVEIC